MSHHNSRRLAGSALLGVPWRCSATSMLASLDVHRSQRCSAFLGVARRHRCLQVSTFTDLSVARRIRSVGSVGRRWQPQRAAAAGAGGRAMGWTTPPHHTSFVLIAEWYLRKYRFYFFPKDLSSPLCFRIPLE